jgi:hypothetical protein
MRRGRLAIDTADTDSAREWILAGSEVARVTYRLREVVRLELQRSFAQEFDSADYDGYQRRPYRAPALKTSAAPKLELVHGARDSRTPAPLQADSPPALTTFGAADSFPQFPHDSAARACAGCGAPTLALLCALCTEGAR